MLFRVSETKVKCNFVTWGLIGMMLLTASCGDKKSGKPKQDQKLGEVPSQVEKPSPEKQVVVIPRGFETGAGELNEEKAKSLIGFGLVTPYSSSFVTKCVIGSEPTVDPLEAVSSGSIERPDGQYVNVLFEHVRSELELERLLDVKIHAKGKFVAVNGDASAQFSKVLKKNEESLHYLYTVDVDNALVRLKDVRLTDEAVELVKTKGRKKFYERCGRHFVAGYKSGGRASMVASLKNVNSNVSETKEVLAQATGLSWSSDAKLKSEARERLKSSNISFVSSYTGGNGFSLSENLDGLIALMNKWPEHVSKHPVVKDLILEDYDSLLSAVDGEKIEDMTEELELLDETYNRLSEKIFSAYAALRNLSPILLKDLDFDIRAKSVFTTEINRATAIMSELKKNIQNCQNTYTLEACSNPDLVSSGELFRFQNIEVIQVADLTSKSCVKSDQVKEAPWSETIITENKERKSCGGWSEHECPEGQTIVNMHHDTGGKCNLVDNWLYYKWSCQKTVTHETEKTVPRSPENYTGCEMKPSLRFINNGRSLGM